MQKLSLIIISFGFVFSAPLEIDQTSSLELVHVFVRHGARYPQITEIYPNDPHKFQEHELGHLNKVGKVNSYKVGKFLKQRYGSFLGNVFKHGIITVTSTSLPRTRMTALLILAGLFPPTTTERWSDETPNWQPVPYDYIDGREDTWLLRASLYCPKYKKEVENVKKSPAIRSLLEKHADSMDYIRNKTGKNITDLEGVFRLYQLFNSEDSLNLALPGWATQVFPYFILNLTLQRYILENSNAHLKKLSGGRMLSKISGHWNQKIKNEIYPSNTKMLLYTVHEHNLVDLMFALNIFNYEFPQYSSAIIFELHRVNSTTDGYAIKILHLEDVHKPPVVKKLEHCNEMCPLNEFLLQMRDVLPKNYTEECESKRNLDRPEWIPPQYRKKKN